MRNDEIATLRTSWAAETRSIFPSSVNQSMWPQDGHRDEPRVSVPQMGQTISPDCDALYERTTL